MLYPAILATPGPIRPFGFVSRLSRFVVSQRFDFIPGPIPENPIPKFQRACPASTVFSDARTPQSDVLGTRLICD
jgi:hypothetical protein